MWGAGCFFFCLGMCLEAWGPGCFFLFCLGTVPVAVFRIGWFPWLLRLALGMIPLILPAGCDT